MIICLGTTPAVQRTMTFDRLSIDAVNRAAGVHQFASGKSINAARVVHALNEAVLATGFVGGQSGRFIRADLDQAGVAHDFIEVDSPTRLCLTIVDRTQHTATELVEESTQVAPDAYVYLLEKLKSLLPRAKALILSGTLPPAAPTNFYADCVALAGSKVLTVVDAKGEPLRQALSRRPFVVKPNRTELGQTLDIDSSDDAAIRDGMSQAARAGAHWVIVTAGKAPTLMTDGSSFWKVDVPVVDAVNPIGSGDALAGGVAVALIRGQDMTDALRLGVACAAANALTAHAGHVDATSVQSLKRTIHAEQISPD